MASAGDLARALERGAQRLGLALSPPQVATLVDYLLLLARWNRAYNLTAVRDPADMVSRHLLDSLSLLPLVRGPALLDVGSGAGLPGLVLSVALPDVRTTLLDPSLKRTRFLAHAVRALSLDNVQVARARLEEYSPGPRFDSVASRASLPLPALLAAAPALLRPGGRLLAMLGRAPETLPAAPAGFRLALHRIEGLGAARHVALMEAAAGH